MRINIRMTPPREDNPHRPKLNLTPALVGKSLLKSIAIVLVWWIAAMVWTKYG